MEKKRVRFLERGQRTGTVVSFRFSAEGIDFTAGQYLRIIFDEENHGNRELNKFLSFSCAPGKEYFEVTKRLSSSEFSARLSSLEPGDEVLCQLPMGTCVLGEKRSVLFLAGGIGITPVISMIEDVVIHQKPVDVFLLYSNVSLKEIAFKNELDIWAAQENINVVYTLTDCDSVNEECLAGRIDKAMITQHVDNLKERELFIFGPPPMVSAMRQICAEIKDCSGKIHFESFTGY